MKPCPKCSDPVKGYVRYIKWYDSECPDCYFREHPEALKVAEEGHAAFREKVRDYNARQAARRREMSNRHPCKKRRRSGVCLDSPSNVQCPFSATKAARMCDPDKFAPKKKGVKA
jgi:hypothetical protein